MTHPPMPPTVMEQYGLPGHLPRCWAVLLARTLRITDPTRCDCGKTGPYALRDVPQMNRLTHHNN